MKELTAAGIGVHVLHADSVMVNNKMHYSGIVEC